MLSPTRDDEDEDNHLCIKCNTTIIGLDNYVKHRKERCGKKFNETLKKNDITLDLEASYNLGADIFFQSLELQSSVKKSNLARLSPPKVHDDSRKQAIPSTSRELPRMSLLENNMRGEDWIGGHSIQFVNNETDNQTKLIDAVASISGNAKKETLTYLSYSEESDEASDDSEEEDDEMHGGKWKPPPNYTGGKWRPDSPEQLYTYKDDHDNTNTKWRPLLDAVEGDDDYDAPPPEHTKGKWVPGAQEQKTIMQTTLQTKTTVQYWCGPCNRKLGSRAVYEKHLMSNLHMKKILPEHDLEFSGHMEPLKQLEKRQSKPSQYTNNSIYKTEAKTKKNKTKSEGKRKRRPIYTHCSGCNSRVRLHLMGKHLISHYHFRKASNTNNITYQKLILNNIEAIVHQSPFQCSPCKFYTNWSSRFMQHWLSEEHKAVTSSIEGRFWCYFCKYECETSEEMLQHISSSDHNEVVAVLNRSMPIIIRKRSVFKCSSCDLEFKYNIEVKKHCERTGHALLHSITDEYQELHECKICHSKFKSSVILAAHLKMKHNDKKYVCLPCNLNFDTAEAAAFHRQTTKHKIRRSELKSKKGIAVKDLQKKCPYCVDLVLANVLKLKEHIQEMHPNMKRKCPKCGMDFILSQEVTRHVRTNACKYQPSLNPAALWSCSQCLYTTESQAECFFHEVLHSEPTKEMHKGKTIQKYGCPICPKKFSKQTLRSHIRQHTFERPFVCELCAANFTKANGLKNHIKVQHSDDAKVVAVCGTDSSKNYQCKTCGVLFPDRMFLERHNAIPCLHINKNIYKCSVDKCTYSTSTLASLTRHKKCHTDNAKRHECPYCSFRSDQSSHLRRHLICHQGSKPYACPHCDFRCGSLENLRKHVLRNGNHPGAFLYSCTECGDAFQTNMATELRAHLTSQHADKYDMKTAIDVVKKHLMIGE